MSPFLIKVCNRLGLLPYLQTRFRKKIIDTEFIIPLFGKLGFNILHLSEPWMTRLLQQLKPLYNGYFTDIGINMGQTLLKAYAVYGDVHYTGFEPNPMCVYYVQQMAEMNNLRNCTIVPVGISNNTEILKLRFYIDDYSDPSASIVQDFRAGEVEKKSISIPVFDSRHLLSFLPTQQNTLVKIDVEGAEAEVLEGLQEWISSSEPIILIEILPVYSEEYADRLERQLKLEKLLKQMNYSIFRISKSVPVHIVPLKEIGIHANPEDCEYILCPGLLSGKLQQCLGLALTGADPAVMPSAI
jgi:FkbM family methyltransferase